MKSYKLVISKKQYKRLLAPLKFEVEYIYILNNWFKKPEYRDVLAYIHSFTKIRVTY